MAVLKRWDRGRARVLYDQGVSIDRIALDVGASSRAVVSYAKRAGWALAEQPAPEPWPDGVPTLPPLPSLTFGD